MCIAFDLKNMPGQHGKSSCSFRLSGVDLIRVMRMIRWDFPQIR